jgi:prolyl-tRNA editing enzyme YbaK/EbsC (Cys-tRNA(Pro) deacylase)
MDALTVADVQAALDQFGLGITITQYQETTATSQQAADRIGCELGQIAKSICFMVKLPDGEKPVLVITSGDQRVDDRKIAALVGVSRKNVRTAKPEECVAVFGYAPGSVPTRSSAFSRFMPQAGRTMLFFRSPLNNLCRSQAVSSVTCGGRKPRPRSTGFCEFRSIMRAGSKGKLQWLNKNTPLTVICAKPPRW